MVTARKTRDGVLVVVRTEALCLDVLRKGGQSKALVVG